MKKYHATSHLGPMNCDRFVSVPKKSAHQPDASVLREEIRKAQSWIVFYSGVSARKRMSKDYCEMQIDTYSRLVASLKGKLAKIEAPKLPDADTVIKALGEVANMTPGEEARLNGIILEQEKAKVEA